MGRCRFRRGITALEQCSNLTYCHLYGYASCCQGPFYGFARREWADACTCRAGCGCVASWGCGAGGVWVVFVVAGCCGGCDESSENGTSDRGNRPIRSSPDPGHRASPTAGYAAGSQTVADRHFGEGPKSDASRVTWSAGDLAGSTGRRRSHRRARRRCPRSSRGRASDRFRR